MEPIAITIPAACKLVSLGRSTLYPLIMNGTIRSVKVGKKRLIEVASLKDWFANQSNGLTPERKTQ